MTTRLLGFMNTNNKTIDEVYLTPEMLVELINMVKSGKISRQQAKEVFALILEEEKTPETIVKEKAWNRLAMRI